MGLSNHKKEMIPNPFAEIDTDLISGTLSDFAPVEIEMICGSNCDPVWNQLVNRHHYLGFQRLLGHRLKYFAFIQDRPVAALSRSAPALKLGQRDCFIGWSADQRKRHLHQVVGNSRFLIMPWVQVPNLASHVMGLNIAQLAKDWKRHFDTQLLLLETFVDSRFFKGTCY